MQAHKRHLLHNPLSSDNGFTLLELVVVIVIMGVLSLVAVRSFTSQTTTRRFEESRLEMEGLKRGIAGDEDRIQDGFRVDFGYVGDMGALPVALTNLVTDPGGGNWSGPYVAVNFADNPNDYLFDAFNVAYIYTPAALTIQSTGANITISLASSATDLLNNTVLLFARDRNGFTPQDADLPNITVTLNLQNSGVIGPDSLFASGGLATIANVPVGNHTVTVNHSVLAENVVKPVSVEPGSTTGPIEIIFTTLP